MTTPKTAPNSLRSQPDQHGHFGTFGGKYAAETLMPALISLETAWNEVRNNKNFQDELQSLLKHYAGRPSPLYEAKRFAAELHSRGAPGSVRVWFKRDELNHTGAHKINNVLGQILLAQKTGKTRIIAETGAGQHGVATATACARVGLPCIVYMGRKDIERQSPNAFRMRLLGAELKAVDSGSATLKDAMNEALRDWVANIDDTFYVIGSVAGPHPYPEMVREFQCVIGHETRAQLAEQLNDNNALPDLLVACVGGGSNAIGLFHPFLDDPEVRMVGVEAGGAGIQSGQHAAALTAGTTGILHGGKSRYLQNDDGQIAEAHSISAGLDYPGAGPEHAWLREIGRVEYVASNDDEVLAAFQICCAAEGIIPALEPSHSLAWLLAEAPNLKSGAKVVVNLCGRGDKDIFTVSERLGVNLDADPGVNLDAGPGAPAP
ncbi:MAG: tryptophan synthase subunit beta [Alphaproteobacteria bacterium]|nr:tryptophan synthase subunit beta [Alphaproteobacteria bacterium]